jgi:hypothetical protein
MVPVTGQHKTFKIDQYRAASIILRRKIALMMIDRDRMREYGAKND